MAYLWASSQTFWQQLRQNALLCKITRCLPKYILDNIVDWSLPQILMDAKLLREVCPSPDEVGS